MAETPKPWKAFYYSDAQGRVPVRDWLSELDEIAQARVLRSVDLLEGHGVNLGVDYSRHLRGKIWELRVRSGDHVLRVLYVAMVGRKFVLLHGFAKRSQKTPEREIETAERRLVDYQARSGGAR